MCAATVGAGRRAGQEQGRAPPRPSGKSVSEAQQAEGSRRAQRASDGVCEPGVGGAGGDVAERFRVCG